MTFLNKISYLIALSLFLSSCDNGPAPQGQPSVKKDESQAKAKEPIGSVPTPVVPNPPKPKPVYQPSAAMASLFEELQDLAKDPAGLLDMPSQKSKKRLEQMKNVEQLLIKIRQDIAKDLENSGYAKDDIVGKELEEAYIKNLFKVNFLAKIPNFSDLSIEAQDEYIGNKPVVTAEVAKDLKKNIQILETIDKKLTGAFEEGRNSADQMRAEAFGGDLGGVYGSALAGIQTVNQQFKKLLQEAKLTRHDELTSLVRSEATRALSKKPSDDGRKSLLQQMGAYPERLPQDIYNFNSVSMGVKGDLRKVEEPGFIKNVVKRYDLLKKRLVNTVGELGQKPELVTKEDEIGNFFISELLFGMTDLFLMPAQKEVLRKNPELRDWRATKVTRRSEIVFDPQKNTVSVIDYSDQDWTNPEGSLNKHILLTSTVIYYLDSGDVRFGFSYSVDGQEVRTANDNVVLIFVRPKTP